MSSRSHYTRHDLAIIVHSWKCAEVTFSPASLSALFPEITSLLSSSFTSTAQLRFLAFSIVYTPVERVIVGRRSSWLEGSARACISRIRDGAWKREHLVSLAWPLESLWGRMMDRIQEQEQRSRGPLRYQYSMVVTNAGKPNRESYQTKPILDILIHSSDYTDHGRLSANMVDPWLTNALNTHACPVFFVGLMDIPTDAVYTAMQHVRVVSVSVDFLFVLPSTHVLRPVCQQ